MRNTDLRICTAVLTVAWVLTGLPSAQAETLGDVLRECGWDRVLGTWVDAETGGEKVKVTYAWRFKDRVVEISGWSKGRESVALMGRKPKTGEVYHVGADSDGGGSIGQWSLDNGDAVLDLHFVSGQGQEGSLRIRQHLEDEKTLLITFEGPEPKTLKMVRAKE